MVQLVWSPSGEALYSRYKCELSYVGNQPSMTLNAARA